MHRHRSQRALTAPARGCRWLLALAAVAGCDGGETKVIGTGCRLRPSAPDSARFPPFYEKYIDATGIPVLASGRPDDRALSHACTIAVHMLSARDDVRRAMIEREFRIGVIARDEVTTDLPDYSDLYALFPNERDWDTLRGVGATLFKPMSSFGEENMLCADADPFRGENVMVETFASSIMLGVQDVDSGFEQRVRAAFDDARRSMLWENTYAGTNIIAYYVSGVQAWFDAGHAVNPPDGTYGPIATRDDLLAYDPALAALVAETMPTDKWRVGCP